MTSGSVAAAEAIRLGHTTLKLFEREVQLLIENNMAALRREFEDAGVEFIDLGRTEVPGCRVYGWSPKWDAARCDLPDWLYTSAPCYYH